MPRPLVGIPPCVDAKERWRAGRVYVYADHAYARAIDAAGGLPVHLPMQSDPAALVRRMDGLLLPGGDDFAPDRAYPDDVRFDLVPEAQLAFDRALLDAALARGLPVLGICYGAQLIALAHGGALHHHIPTDLASAMEHRLPEDGGRHPLRIEAGTRLAHVFEGGPDAPSVNSLHHQGVARLGRDLVATAHAPDGLIEGFESTGAHYLVGVQWHPEKMGERSSQRLFEAFVSACMRARPLD